MALLLTTVTFAPASAIGRTVLVNQQEADLFERPSRPSRALGTWRVWLSVPGNRSASRGPIDLVPRRDTSSLRYTRYDGYIRDAERLYDVPSALLHAVIQTESDFDPAVVSRAGARGLMQLMPDTANLMGVTDPFDPRQSIMGGGRYLHELTLRFCPARTAPGRACAPLDNLNVLAAYHAGPGAVEKYGGVPPYETTRAYVATVLRHYADWTERLSGSVGRYATARSAIGAEFTVSERPRLEGPPRSVLTEVATGATLERRDHRNEGSQKQPQPLPAAGSRGRGRARH